jgi:predicted transcriptional regulator
MKAILSIKPKFVEEIISGRKRFEFRRRIFKKKISTILVYSSSPIQKFVGEI